MEDPIEKGNAIVRQSFPTEAASPADLSVLLDRVRAFHEEGICVCAFRPPVPPQVMALEDEIGLVDYEDLAAALEAAGAHWIEVDASTLRSYDGSHLDGPSARALSAQLARGITAACGR